MTAIIIPEERAMEKDNLRSSNNVWGQGINYCYIKNGCWDERILNMPPNMCYIARCQLSQHEVAFVIAWINSDKHGSSTKITSASTNLSVLPVAIEGIRSMG